MNGYVRNKSHIWRHAMKRSVGPGAKIPLDDLYEQYGVKNSIDEGQPFIDWLRYVKLKDINVWEIKYGEEEDPVAPETVNKEKKNLKSRTGSSRELDNTPSSFVTDVEKLTVDELTLMPVRMAREKLPRVNNIKDLKYALHQASQLANKDTLCRMLKKRIQELTLISKT